MTKWTGEREAGERGGVLNSDSFGVILAVFFKMSIEHLVYFG